MASSDFAPMNLDDIVERYKKSVLLPWSAQQNAKPSYFTTKKGVYLTLPSGKRLMDMKAQAFFANLGHSHEGMRQALGEAGKNVEALGSDTVCLKRLELAEKLLSISPQQKMKKVFFSLGGAEANENAIKIARLVTKKFKVITRYRSYHGATLAMMSLSGDYRRIPTESMMPGVIRIPDPYLRGSGQNIDTVKLLEEIIQIEGPETIAAIMLEGITGANGVFIPPDSYWPRIREICDRHNIILIADEVFSGFFRTGKWFGVDNFNTVPDIITMSKGLTAGYAPLGALMVNEKIANFFDNETIWCGLTQYGPYLSCAAAIAAINFYEQEKIPQNVAERERELKEWLLNLQEKYEIIAETRCLGLLAAIDFKKSKNDESALVPYRASGEDLKPSLLLQKLLFENGISALVRFSTLILSPPLNIKKEELKEAMQNVENSIAQFLASIRII